MSLANKKSHCGNHESLSDYIDHTSNKLSVSQKGLPSFFALGRRVWNPVEGRCQTIYLYIASYTHENWGS